MASSTPRSIPLVTGDPAGKEPASFTRFALPFAWSLEQKFPQHERKDRNVYRRDEPVSAQRRNYFTPETGGALYDRALWFRLEGSEEKSAPREDGGHPAGSFRLCVGRKPITIQIAPPRLVLFEAATSKRKKWTAGTGFLIIDVHFPDPHHAPNLDDLLAINERFRYWRSPFEGHLTKFTSSPDGRISYRRMMRRFRAIQHSSDRDLYFDWWENLLTYPVRIGNSYHRLVSTEDVCKTRAWNKSEERETGWVAYTDERSFVWTCALTSRGAGDASAFAPNKDPVLSSEWVHLLNVDAEGSVPSHFERDWVKTRTYTRWQHFGTLYGFTTHSGAMLGAFCKEPPTWQHFRQLYFDEALLLLYLRVSLFRFEVELSSISAHLLSDQGVKEIKEFRDLRKRFAFLTNLYRFPLLSSQQQGIEMYVYMRNALDIEELFKEVQEEIKTTHEMFEFTTTSRMGEATAFLTIGVLVLGILSTVMTFLMVDDLKEYGPIREHVLQHFKHIPRLMPSAALILFSVVASLILSAVLLQRWFRWFSRLWRFVLRK